MKKLSRPHGAHLRGATRLATDAALGLTDLVEALHERIARFPGWPAPAVEGRTTGVTGLVYKTVRGVTHLVGGTVDALLEVLTPVLAGTGDLPERGAVIAALNGVLGDHLAATHNPLATPMSLRLDGQALVLQPAALAAPALPAPPLQTQPGPRVLVLIHGLCMNDLQWTRDGHNHGLALARELGFTPLYLRYNSGLHVSCNGRELALQLQQLVDGGSGRTAPAVQQLVIIGHSMGGLLARSAVHAACQAGMGWPALLTDLVFLGTPHHGAPLERAGNWIDIMLGATPYAKPFARLGKVRSAGITDLRHGNLLDEDWLGRDRFARRANDDAHLPLPLPVGVRCFALATHLGQSGDELKNRLLGDGLVPLDSALGRHPDPARRLDFAPDRQWTGAGINHLQMLGNKTVYAQLLRWLTPPSCVAA